MDEKVKYGLGGVVLGGVLVWGSMYTILNANNSGVMGMMGLGNVSLQRGIQSSNGIDAHFIEQMIPHHEDAITMAKLALVKAQKPEIKTLAASIIESQGKEITQMKTWYKDWFGKEVPEGDEVMEYHGMMGGTSSMHMGMMGDDQDMEKLSTASDFDTEFIKEMIPHHQMAVMMANMLKNSTQRSEMKKLADDIITAQTKEIEEMRTWYKAWGLY